VLGAVAGAMMINDMFAILKQTWIVPMTFAALFWVGMYWRRATTKAGWITISFCVLSFFVLPRLIPTVAPSLRTDPEFIQSNVKTETGGGKSIYWTEGIEKIQGVKQGQGQFRFDMLLYDKILGYDLTQVRNATLATLDLPFKIIAPFLVMIIASLLTKPNNKEALDRLYVKMKTPVNPVPEKDEAEIEKSYANPDRFDKNKLFPNSNLEFQRPTRYDVIGFLTCFALCFAIIGLVLLVAQIGT
jgi:SSS family solute:Na+ symporter